MLSKTFDHNPLDIKKLIQKNSTTPNLKLSVKTIIVNFSTESIYKFKNINVVIIEV